ncbi:D-alanyl-D-alanine carboxypeptidase [Conexibacter sp. SYSU D00693]|uniref:D-alanyl-D-alanine carboxypeptidase n=1 Tax=Conexibacter sp. SYSU D00693 TaxID=2812560 RepID=UPI00196AB63B|nr:D-alanyl-D-alanine carboxypeptidase [Conexibacter sp. SYSU D00693]
MHRVRVLPLALLLAAALLAAAAPAASAAQDRALRSALSRLAARAGGTTSFAVTDVAAKRVLARVRDTRVTPLASTTKLLTTAAALRTLQPLETGVLLAGPVAGGVLAGDVVLRGGGDGLLGDAELATLATAVQAAGVREVQGSVVGDGTRFDALRGGPGTAFAFDPEIGGTLGALTYLRGRATPAGPVQPDPAQAAAARFDDVLEARGLVVRGTPRAGTTPLGAVLLGRTQRRVADVVRAANTDSDDFLAETLLKAVGAAQARAGTTAAGAAAATRVVRRLGARQVTLADGAGLVPGSRGSVRDLVALLVRLRGTSAFTSSLAVAGRTGTLRDRLTASPARGRCRAKTGTLPDTRVSALAGICRARGDRRVAFAIVTTGSAVERARPAQDAMVQRLARWRRGARR